MINDYIHLSDDDMDSFAIITQGMSNETTESTFAIPSDLFFAQTIPLREMAVVRTEGSDKYYYRFPKVDAQKDVYTNCGEIEIVGTDASFQQNVGVTRGGQSVTQEMLFKMNGAPIPNGRLAEAYASGEMQGMLDLFTHALAVWYGIQIAMLNPYVKNVFRTETIRKTGFNPNGKKRKSIVKYIRHHYLNPGALSPKTETGQLLRKTMAWYVCGHWRHYQDGKTIFIQPYWKGPLRKAKVCEPRERVIV